MVPERRLGLLVLLLVCGCFQRIFPIRTVETEDGVAFELPEVVNGFTDGRHYELLNLMVTSRGCSSYCTLWSIASPLDSSIMYLPRARISYGELVRGTEVRTPAQTLAPGTYSVSLGIREYGARNEFLRGLSMDSKFEIDRDGSGKLRVVSHDRSGETAGCT